MNYNDIKIGEYYKFSYGDPLGMQLVFIVGRDPFTGKFVASCQEWLNAVDLIDDDDLQFMEEI